MQLLLALPGSEPAASPELQPAAVSSLTNHDLLKPGGPAGARLIELDGVGHQLPPPHTWDLLVDALVEQTHA